MCVCVHVKYIKLMCIANSKCVIISYLYNGTLSIHEEQGHLYNPSLSQGPKVALD